MPFSQSCCMSSLQHGALPASDVPAAGHAPVAQDWPEPSQRNTQTPEHGKEPQGWFFCIPRFSKEVNYIWMWNCNLTPILSVVIVFWISQWANIQHSSFVQCNKRKMCFCEVAFELLGRAGTEEGSNAAITILKAIVLHKYSAVEEVGLFQWWFISEGICAVLQLWSCLFCYY